MTQRRTERQIPVKVAQRINSMVAAVHEKAVCYDGATPAEKKRIKQQFNSHRSWLERAIIQWVEDEVKRATETAVAHNQQVGWTKAVARIHSVIEAGNTIGGVRATVNQMMIRPLDVQEPQP